ncbi:hypothetical protein ALNOE001_05260 [Candidatus Methanobinarius endosymbioticus]|uniref:Bacterial Ig-like domain-containing protein n=1 Tax=Candidatus Methanobinarius endosymbioticus TaxID=2006182 RepID=A0A366MER4_9EURY|nr:hypothetical protein ALNOE001_05260 [Candidatus Methanobinarius endosymbioticus]
MQFYYYNGTHWIAIGSPVNLVNDQATLNYTFPNPGDHEIRAEYLGTDEYNPFFGNGNVFILYETELEYVIKQ